MRQAEGSAKKTPMSCPNILIKMHNASMGGVDVIDQKTTAYQLNRKSKFRFHLMIFSDLIDIAIVNSHIVLRSWVIQFPYLILKLLLQNR